MSRCTMKLSPHTNKQTGALVSCAVCDSCAVLLSFTRYISNSRYSMCFPPEVKYLSRKKLHTLKVCPPQWGCMFTDVKRCQDLFWSWISLCLKTGNLLKLQLCLYFLEVMKLNQIELSDTFTEAKVSHFTLATQHFDDLRVSYQAHHSISHRS